MKHIFYLSILMIFALATTSCAEEEEVYTGSIQGIVTESGTTNPLSGVQVSIVNTGTSTTTGSDGQFMFTDIEAKSYRLQFSKDGYETNTRSVTVVAGGTANCDTQLDPVAQDAEISITPSTLNFGTTQDQLSVTLRNNGNAETEWSISGITEGCISVSETGGTVEAGGSKVVKVLLDRSMLTTDLNTSFVISDMIREQIINVTASLDGSDDPGSDPDDPSGTVVTSGLYTYYKFDGDFTDSYNSVDGYGNNSPQFVEGVDGTGQAVKFNRTDNSSFVVGQSIMDSHDVTVSFWGKDFDDGHIFHTVRIDNGNMYILGMTEGHLKISATNLFNYHRLKPFQHTSINDGKWHHIVLCIDYNSSSSHEPVMTTTLYIDGLIMGTVSEDGSDLHMGGDVAGEGAMFVLGGSVECSDVTLNGTNMTIDNFRVYDTRSLSAQEIKQIYEAKQ